MAFFIGQKVCCVRSGVFSNPTHPGTVTVKKGNIYTIRGFDLPASEGELLGLYFEEIGLPQIPGYREPSFNAERFRPIVEKKTDISQLEEIARRASRTMKVDA